MDLKAKIFKIEAEDAQYQALKDLSSFLPEAEGGFFVIGLALVSYQLSWTGELWRKDVAFLGKQLKKKIENRQFLESWQFVLKNSSYNKRLHNAKIKRLRRFVKGREEFLENINSFEDLEKFNKWLSQLMEQPLDAKTIVFAIKIWGWRLRNFGVTDMFPFAIKIPLDSRWIKLFEKMKIKDKKRMQQSIDNISARLNIAPLHIDGILWPLIKDENIEDLKNLHQLLRKLLGISSHN